MRFLLDMGCAPLVSSLLRELGHDVSHLRELGLQRLDDKSILAMARAENRVVVTFDLDFGELLAMTGTSGPSVVLFQIQAEPARAIFRRLQEAVALEAAALEAGAIVVVEKYRIRTRYLPIQKPGCLP